jgi:hypothetical protein
VKQRSLVSVSDRQFKKEQLKFAKKFRELMAQKYGEEFNPHRLLVDDEKTPGWQKGKKRTKRPRYPVVKKGFSRSKKEKQKST